MQAVSYTTGVPAMIGAMMFLTGKWRRAGVFNVEEFDPDPFMEQLNKQGLPGTKSSAKTLNCNSIRTHNGYYGHYSFQNLIPPIIPIVPIPPPTWNTT